VQRGHVNIGDQVNSSQSTAADDQFDRIVDGATGPAAGMPTDSEDWSQGTPIEACRAKSVGSGESVAEELLLDKHLPAKAVGFDWAGNSRAETILIAQNRILHRLVEGASLESALLEINEFVEGFMPDSICSIMLVEPDGQYLALMAGARLPQAVQVLAAHFPIGEGMGVCGTAAFRRETVIAEDVATDPLLESVRDIIVGAGMRSLWSVPVFGRKRSACEPSRLLATFAVYRSQPHVPDDAEREVVAVATHLVGMAIERQLDAEAVVASEARYRALLDHARVVIWESLPTTFDYSYVSPHAEELLGFPPENWLVPGFWSRQVHPEDLEATRSKALCEGQAGRGYRLQYRMLARDGRVVWVDDKVTVVVEGGRVVAHRGVLADISDVKQSQQAVAETERRLNMLSALTQSVAFAGEVDPDGGLMIHWTTTHFGSIAGYSRDELNELGWKVLVHKEDQQRMREVLERAQAGETIRGHTRFVTKAGRVKHVLHYIAPLHPSEPGSQLIGAVVDITEWKETELALGESQERFREIAWAVNEVFWMVSVPDGELLYLSRAYEQVWGRPLEPIRAGVETWDHGIHPDDREDVLKAYHRFLAEPETERFEVEYRVVRPNGEIRRIVDSGGPVRNADGKVYRATGIARDVTDQRLLEAKLMRSQKLEVIGRMAGGIAHDFNNWLTVIMGTCDLLRNGLAVDDHRRQAVEQIEAAGQHAGALTRQLLAVSSRQVLTPRPLDLNEVVRRLEPMLRRLLGEDLVITISLETGLRTIFADASQIEQVLINLAVNARDAMPARGQLRIATANTRLHSGGDGGTGTLPPGGYVRLTVTDTGCGIPEDIRAHLFEPFFTTKAPGRGSGLGLATVLGIVRQSGGDVFVDTQVGQGTTFTLLFPASDVAAEVPVLPAVPTPADRDGTMVLLVEDETAVRTVVRGILERRGYRVLEALDGPSAEVFARKNRDSIQLVVTDVVMPGMCGRELADSLRATIPGIPILFTSGHTDEALVNHGIAQATEEFLQKPFTPQLLLAKVNSLLAR
jgi:PAS domain S-box-containing protein